MNRMSCWNRVRLTVVNECINSCFDVRHGHWFGGVKRTSICSVQSSDVRTIAALFRRVFKAIPSREPIIDVGCGKGRVVQWIISHLPNPVVGVEIDEEVADKTRIRFAGNPQVEIVTGDIADCLRPEWQWFYMMNTFGSPGAMGSFIRFLGSVNHRAFVSYLNVNKINLDDLRFLFPDWQFNAMGGLNSGGRWDDLGIFVHGGV
jgi:SAM-dependent methyltransferase